MKLLFTFLLLLSGSFSFAQSNNQLYGKWIKVRAVYKDGSELYDSDLTKYNYTKLIFGKPDKCTIALSYNNWDKAINFSVISDILQLETDKGFIMNQFRVEKLTTDTMVLVQQNNGTWDDPACIKLYYVPESRFQNSEQFTTEDIVKITGADTLFKASEKVYADFNGDVSFHLLEQISTSDLQIRTPIKIHFLATFIVDKNGLADSIKIIEGINPDFDKQYVKTFLKHKSRWIPATRNGKPVSVQMNDEFWFGTFMPNMFDPDSPVELANKAMKTGNYDFAIINYTKAIRERPYVGDYYYKRAFCYLAKDNGADACADLQKAKEFGCYAANGLIKRFCK